MPKSGFLSDASSPPTLCYRFFLFKNVRLINFHHPNWLFSFPALQHVEHFRNFSDAIMNTDFSSRQKRSIGCEFGSRRMRRSCVIIPPAPPKPTPYRPMKIVIADKLGFDGNFFEGNQTPNYNLTIFESSCVFWDDVNQTWSSEGCRVC